MKKIVYVILIVITFLLPGKVNASRVSIYSQGVYAGGSDITIFGERFWQFSQVTSSQWRLEIGYEVTSPKYFSVSGFLYVENRTDAEGVIFPNLALTTLSNACKIEYSNFATSGDDGLNDIRQKNSLYYFECNHVNYNVNHLLRFELLGQYPDFLGKVYLYDWLNFSYDDDGSTQSIIDNQNKNQSQTNSRLDSMKEQQHQDSQNEVNATNKNTEAINGMNDTIKDSNINDANSSASEFFSGFESDDFGLSSIIIAPLNLIKSITSSTCKPIGFKAPFVEQQVTLPCMRAIYDQHFGVFLTIYQTITFGMVAYWVSVKILFMVKGFKDPDSDRIEVLDL